MPARGRFYAPRRRRSTCWCSPGLWTPIKLPYNRMLLSRSERDMTAAIEIYTRPGCGYCSAARSLLTRKKAEFTEYNVAINPTLHQQMWDRAGAGSTFPQIFINQTHVGGCDELYALDRQGKLDSMLAGERAST